MGASLYRKLKMRVTQTQFESFLVAVVKHPHIAIQEFTNENPKAEIRRCINFVSNNIIAASIDNKRFYIAV